jgi:hypothetical protein
VPPADDKNRLEELKKSLYSRNMPDVRTRRKLRFSEEPMGEVKPGWQEPKEKEQSVHLNETYEDHSMSFFTKLLIASFVFCLAAVGIGVYLFLNGANMISGNNIDISINGPVSIQGGEPVSFTVKVTNNNNVALQLVDMSVAFPAGATDPKDSTKALTTYEQLLGDMPTGVATSTSISAIIFGEENAQKEITVTLTYSVKGSSAVFTKEQSYDVLINSSPITVSVDSFSSITSGQAFDMTVNLKSNSQNTLKNVILKAQYPFGYTFASSNLPALSDKTTWKIGDIPPGGSRSIVIHGTLQGEDTDIRAFHFSVGAQNSSNTATVGTEYGAIEQDMTIEKPFISLGLVVDGDSSSGDHVGSFGQSERVAVNWFNNLSTAVSDVVITVDLSGSAYDKNKVQANGSYFDSANNRIVWNPQTNPDLASIPAGGSGTLSFIITPADLGTTANPIVNPTISVSSNVSADRIQQSGVSGTLSATESRTIKISSSIALSGRLVRSVGPFGNTGPIPPKAEQKTSYTVVWTVGNTSNTADNAQVTATLPPYVSWLGNVNPSTENITYDQTSGTIAWNVGTVNAGSSVTSANRREVDFQIALDPSVSQAGTVPTLINPATLTAKDDFTGASIQSSQDYLTTSYSTDPVFKEGDEIVTR